MRRSLFGMIILVSFLVLPLSTLSWGAVPAVTATKLDRPSTASPIVVTFSETMDLTSMNGSTVSLKDTNNTNIPLVFPTTQTPNSTNPQRSDVFFQPAVILAFSAPYTLTLTTGVKNSTAVGLASDYTAPITTVAAVIEVTPKPTDKAAVATTIKITFSEAMDLSTINGSTFLLKDSGNTTVPVIFPTAQTQNPNCPPGSKCEGWRDLVFRPSSGLAYGTIYTVTIKAGVKGTVTPTSMPSDFTSTFQTVLLPTVTSPSSNGTAFPVTGNVTVTFNQAMDPNAISAFTVKSGTTPVSGTVSYDPATYTFTFKPTTPLAYNTPYTATLSIAMRTGTGIALSQPYSWSFTTQSPPQFNLTVSYSPDSGAGTVNSLLPTTAIHCDGQTGCSASFVPGTGITLTASPSEFFAGWSGGCSGTGNCQVVINADTNVVASFDHRLRIRETMAGFDTFSAAYGSDSLPDRATIEARAFESSEVFDCYKNISVTIRGGYDKIFSSILGYSILSGTLTVGKGSLTVENLIVR
jgi:Big-like domain-containing protein